MILENPGDSLGVFGVLPRNQSQIRYLVSVIRYEILERALVVLGHLIRGYRARHGELGALKCGLSVIKGIASATMLEGRNTQLPLKESMDDADLGRQVGRRFSTASWEK